MTSEVLKKGGEVTSEVWGETRGFDFEGMRFGMKAWRASASDAGEDDAPAALIVLVHGFAQQASTWDKVALSLSRTGVEMLDDYLRFLGHRDVADTSQDWR